MSQRKGGKLFRLLSVVIDGRGEVLFLYRRQIDFKLCIQVIKDIPGIFCGRNGRIQTCEMADLFRSDRANACKAGVERFGERAGLCGQQGDKIFL